MAELRERIQHVEEAIQVAIQMSDTEWLGWLQQRLEELQERGAK